MTTFRFTNKRPWMDYLGSEAGRNALMVASGLAGATVATAIWLPQCLAINKLKNILQMYKDGYPVKPTPCVIDLAAETLADCKVTEDEAKQIRWFTAFGFGPIHKGQTSFSRGSIIGLPKTFGYNSADDIDRTSIKMHRDNSIPWKSDVGVALTESLLFSEEARKSAIATEIFSCQTNHVLIKAMTVGLIIPVVSTTVSKLNDRFGLSRFSRKIRLATYSAWALLGLSFGVFAWDLLHRQYEQEADDKVAQLGEKYLQGAVEFYSKQMLTNRALRELLGKEGQRTYTAEGNRNYLLRQPHLALSARKDFFEKKLLHLRSEKIKENENGDVEDV